MSSNFNSQASGARLGIQHHGVSMEEKQRIYNSVRSMKEKDMEYIRNLIMHHDSVSEDPTKTPYEQDQAARRKREFEDILYNLERSYMNIPDRLAKYHQGDHRTEEQEEIEFTRKRREREIERVRGLIQHHDAISKDPNESPERQANAKRHKAEALHRLDLLHGDLWHLL